MEKLRFYSKIGRYLEFVKLHAGLNKYEFSARLKLNVDEYYNIVYGDKKATLKFVNMFIKEFNLDYDKDYIVSLIKE